MEQVKCDICEVQFPARERFWYREQDKCCSSKCLQKLEGPRRASVSHTVATPYRKADVGGCATY